jgi:Replication-relaxation
VLDDLSNVLQRDKVMSLGQCLHHYNVTRSELDKQFILKEDFLSETNYTRHSSRFTFVCRDKKTAQRQGSSLRHLAGVTEMRLLLKADPLSWRNQGGRVNSLLIPDGIWHQGRTKIAIEYDTGSYSKEQLEQKISAYQRHYLQQIWGTPSVKRLEKLNAMFLEAGLGEWAQVLYAPWW